MSILSKLSPKFRVDVKLAPSTEAEIAALMAYAPIEIPEEFLDIVGEATDVEICVDNQMYIRTWSATHSLSMNQALEVQKYVPKSLAFGDNEGGKGLIYVTECASDDTP